MPKLNSSVIISALSALALIFTACTDNTSAPQELYTVISDGTTAVTEITTVTEKYADVSEKELNIPEHMVTPYASLGYDERMKDAYDDVVEAMSGLKPQIKAPLTISTEDYYKVLETVRCEQLSFFFLQNRWAEDSNPADLTFEMNFSYKYPIKDINIMLLETEEAAKEIVALTDENMSDYEKLKIFHDYMVLNIESSTEDEYADSVYGALVKKKALCEGYAKAFSYLCNMVGIENVIVTGITNVDHMWNMVKVNDKWYHVDIGWDKPAPALAELYPDMILYQYFLAEDSVMENNRIIRNMLFEPPNAESTDMNYFIKENMFAENYEEALEIIKSSCAKSIDAGEKYFMLKLDTSNLYLQTTAQLIKPDSNGVTDIDRLVEELNFKGKISYIDYYEAYRIIIFVLE